MTFTPILATTGYTGWRFLERTRPAQQAVFAKNQPVQRATDYFREKIGTVRNADDLVNDRQLLTVALGAFGLDEDINNKFFIRKILADGTVKDGALSSRLADNRYADFSRAFGFGDGPVPRTALPNFADQTISKFEKRQFERAVGDQNNDLRLALNLQSGLNDILTRSSTENAQWFSIMGNTPLRKVFETALGLPTSIASIDIDKQRDIFKSRSRAIFGSDKVANFADPDQQEKLIRLFLVRSEAAQTGGITGASAALSLLQSAPRLGRRA